MIDIGEGLELPRRGCLILPGAENRFIGLALVLSIRIELVRPS